VGVATAAEADIDAEDLEAILSELGDGGAP
jgi:hypothetical protein